VPDEADMFDPNSGDVLNLITGANDSNIYYSFKIIFLLTIYDLSKTTAVIHSYTLIIPCNIGEIPS